LAWMLTSHLTNSTRWPSPSRCCCRSLFPWLWLWFFGNATGY